MANSSGIIIPILSEFNSKGTDSAVKSLKNLAKGTLTAGAAAGTLVAFTKQSISAAMSDAKAQKQLSLALSNATGASVSQQIAVEKNIASMQYQYAVADDDLRPALASLARVTGDVTKSQDLLRTSLDISAATGRDLQSVTASIGRAYQGNVGALRRLGLRISDATVQSKDFGAAMEEVKGQVDGAGQAAADTAEGQMKKLSIRFQDLSENVGNNLLRVLLPVTDTLASLADNSQKAKQDTGLLSDAMGILKTSVKVVFPELQFLSWLVRDNGNAMETTSGDLLGLSSLMGRVTDKLDALAEKNKAALDKARTAAASLAKESKNNLANALQKAQDKLQAVKDEASSLAGSLRDAVTGYVSLANAVDLATSADEDYKTALQDRADAYAELNKLQDERKRRGFDINDQVIYDADAYATALENVAKAEENVKTAQAKKVDYASAFQTQIAGAKQFATDLKALATGNPPLGLAGIQQLLDAGPVAGDAIAKELLKGTGGLTVAGLNADLSSLATAGQQLGDVTATGVFGSAITSAQKDVNLLKQASVKGGDTNVYIQVMSADPNAVVDALKKYMKQNGSVPIKVKQL